MSEHTGDLGKHRGRDHDAMLFVPWGKELERTTIFSIFQFFDPKRNPCHVVQCRFWLQRALGYIYRIVNGEREMKRRRHRKREEGHSLGLENINLVQRCKEVEVLFWSVAEASFEFG